MYFFLHFPFAHKLNRTLSLSHTHDHNRHICTLLPPRTSEMGESFCNCCDCGEATSDYRSRWCEHCEQHVCRGCCFQAHQESTCPDLENRHDCEHCQRVFRSTDFEEHTGKGDIEGLMCRACYVYMCDACICAHTQSKEHQDALVEQEQERVNAEQRAARKRQRQEEPENVEKRARFHDAVADAKRVHKASEDALQAAQSALMSFDRQLSDDDCVSPTIAQAQDDASATAKTPS
jgi:hypothetical protein